MIIISFTAVYKFTAANHEWKIKNNKILTVKMLIDKFKDVRSKFKLRKVFDSKILNVYINYYVIHYIIL